MSGNFLYETIEEAEPGGFSEETYLLKKEDFVEFFSRFKEAEKIKKSDSELHDVRMLQWFVANRFNNVEMDEWVLNCIAKQFYKVLMGAQWGEAFSLPWVSPPDHPFTKTERRNLQIFCDIKNMITQKNIKLTGDGGAIDIVANNHSVDYQIAHKAYYHWQRETKDIQPPTTKDKTKKGKKIN